MSLQGVLIFAEMFPGPISAFKEKTSETNPVTEDTHALSGAEGNPLE